MSVQIRSVRVLLTVVVLIGLWVPAGMVITWFETWRLATYAPESPLDPREARILGAMRGIVWAAVTPIIIECALRWPVRAPRRLRNLARLGVATIVLALSREVLGSGAVAIAGAAPFDMKLIWVAWALRLDVNILIIASIIAATNMVALQRETAAREKRELQLKAAVAESELRQLRADLQPHFLFNAIHGISALLHIDSARADRMLMRLSSLLQRTLETREESSIPLRDELDLARDYLELSRMRFGERLGFSIEASPAVLHHRVPPLLLQPLVENAVKHGPIAAGAPDLIRISARAEGDDLILEVTDGGAGFVADAGESGQGLGLSSTIARLQLLYGDRAHVEFRRVLDRFAVCLRLPRDVTRPQITSHQPDSDPFTHHQRPF